jgi:hypothetical protein
MFFSTLKDKIMIKKIFYISLLLTSTQITFCMEEEPPALDMLGESPTTKLDVEPTPETLTTLKTGTQFKVFDGRLIAFDPKDLDLGESGYNPNSPSNRLRFGWVSKHTRNTSGPVSGHGTLNILIGSEESYPAQYISKIDVRSAKKEELVALQNAWRSGKSKFAARNTSEDVEEMFNKSLGDFEAPLPLNDNPEE